MKISRIIIRDFQQFGLLDLDLTYPKGHEKEGQPLDKVCLIGKNGTGKTTLLEIVKESLGGERFSKLKSRIGGGIHSCELVIRFLAAGNLVNRGLRVIHGKEVYNLFQDTSKDALHILDSLNQSIPVEHDSIGSSKETDDKQDFFLDQLEYEGTLADSDLTQIIYSPFESLKNDLLQTSFFPEATLHEAVHELKMNRREEELTFDRAKDFWRLVLRHYDDRESARALFEQKPGNIDKTKRILIEEFDNAHPDFLDELASLWNGFLDPLGLYFDVEHAARPHRMQDNLEVYIRTRSGNTPIPYRKLSTGIRHIIFRMGYFAALMQSRKDKPVIALFDEPEASLFPDLQYDLISRYREVGSNTQFFFATHSPIIAAQFEPWERVVLDFDETGKVVARKGIAPLGDDPNDLLLKDFGREEVMGTEGLKAWKSFLELQRMILQEKDQAERKKHIQEYLRIGNLYGFPEHEKATKII